MHLDIYWIVDVETISGVWILILLAAAAFGFSVKMFYIVNLKADEHKNLHLY